MTTLFPNGATKCPKCASSMLAPQGSEFFGLQFTFLELENPNSSHMIDHPIQTITDMMVQFLTTNTNSLFIAQWI